MISHGPCHKNIAPANTGAAAHRLTKEERDPTVIASNDDIPPCVTVIMAVTNEAATVLEMVRAVLRQRPVQELIVVDDASTDDTWPRLLTVQDARLRLLRQVQNRGNRAALRRAIALAHAPCIVIQDADLEYDPAEYHLLLRPMLMGKVDVVYGSRFAGAGSRRVLSFWHPAGHRLLTLLSNMLTDLNLTHMETCFKAVRRQILQGIEIEEDRFGVEPELTAKVARLQGIRIYEVPISYHGRGYSEGKKICRRDGGSALRCILRYNLMPKPAWSSVRWLRKAAGGKL